MTLYNRCKKPLLLCLGMSALWAVQFLLLPKVLPRYFPQSNEATALLLLPVLLASILGTWLCRFRLVQWLPADALYALLTSLFGDGLYGIGLRGIRLDGAAPVYSPTLSLLMTAGLLTLLILTQGVTTAIRRKSRIHTHRSDRPPDGPNQF